MLSWLFALLLLGGEIYYRFFCDRSDALCFTKVSERWFQRHFKLNGGDCRDSLQYAVEIAPGKRRLSFLGDSFAAGHGIKDVEDRFANIIRRDNPDWEIQVLARIGYDTGTENKFVEALHAEGYQFDQVVLVYCLNDATDLFPDWTATCKNISAAVAAGGWLRANSYFLDTLYFLYFRRSNEAIGNYYKYIKESYEGEIWEQQKARLVQLREQIEASGGKLKVVTFPFVERLRDNYPFAEAHKVLNDFWAQQGIPHLDLREALAEAKESLIVNPYDPHPNELANKIAAREISDFLKLDALSKTNTVGP